MKIIQAISAIFSASILTLIPVNIANASSNSVSFTVRVSGHVATNCNLRSSGSYEQIGQDVFRIGSVDRYCNTAYQMTLGHSANTNGGTITFDGYTVPLQDTSVLLIADGAPVNRTSDIIISGIDAETARAIAGSLQLQISPRNL